MKKEFNGSKSRIMLIIGFPCTLENCLKRHEIGDSDAGIPASGLDS